MAKSSSAVAKITRRKITQPTDNPPFWQDLYQEYAPAVVGFAATKIAGRIAFKLAKRKSMTLAKHVGPWASVAVAGLTWFGLHSEFAKARQWDQKYHSATVGATVAAVMGLVQTYMPVWSWMLNDYHLDDFNPKLPAPSAANTGSAASVGEYAELEHTDAQLADVLDIGEGEADLYGGIFGR